MTFLAKHFLSLFFSFFIGIYIYAQNTNTVLPPAYIKSVVLQPNKPNMYFPIVALGETLNFSFDDINANEIYYSYRIEHCDYNWNISNLSSTEYMTGYAEDRIRDYTNSFNTLQGYTHYQLQIPNDNNRIIKSGNYLLSVLDEDYNVVFNRRFIVYQPKVQVGVTAHRTTEVKNINTKHAVQFVVNHPNLLINNPGQEIKIAVYQNGDWNSVKKNIPPRYIQGNQLKYNYVDEISFWAGNEYRYFDTKEIRNATNNIYKTVYNNIFDTYLYTSEIRGDKPYTFYPDINGNFVLRTIDAEDVATEGDYSWVHFTLENNLNLNKDPIYIYGGFNDWKITEETKMKYNPQTKLFETTLLLKQGFYNYTYVSAKNTEQIDITAVDGSFYQTENDYIVIVYYKKFGDLYDQVIGVGVANSERLQN